MRLTPEAGEPPKRDVTAEWTAWLRDSHNNEEVLNVLNTHLRDRTYMIGRQHTRLDDLAAGAVFKHLDSPLSHLQLDYPHICRWIRLIGFKKMLELPVELGPVLVLEEPLQCEKHVEAMWARVQAAQDTHVIGLDTEWAHGKTVVLLQLCDESAVLLLRLPQCLPSPSLSALLRDSTHSVKSGVAVLEDAAMLQEQHGLVTNGCIDLRGPAGVLNLHDRGRDGLQALTRAVLNRDLSKDPKIRCGDWSADPLSKAQITYGALDAIAGQMILVKMFKDHSTVASIASFVEPFVDVPSASKTKAGPSNKAVNMPVPAKESTAKPRDADTKSYEGGALMLAPDGKPMCRIPARKVRFYLERRLASVIREESADEERIIQLNFEPKGYGHREDEGNLAKRIDACVACGTDTELHRFSVIPPAIRQGLPTTFKSNNHRDIMILCHKCWTKLEPAYNRHRRLLFQRAGIDAKANKYRVDPERRNVRNAASALKMHSNDLPQQRQEELKEVVSHFLGHDATSKEIDELTQMSIDVAVANYVQPEEQLLNMLMGEGDLDIERFTKFVQGWRKVFVDTLRPRNLPAGWSIDSPVMAIRTNHPTYTLPLTD